MELVLYILIGIISGLLNIILDIDIVYEKTSRWIFHNIRYYKIRWVLNTILMLLLYSIIAVLLCSLELSSWSILPCWQYIILYYISCITLSIFSTYYIQKHE